MDHNLEWINRTLEIEITQIAFNPIVNSWTFSFPKCEIELWAEHIENQRVFRLWVMKKCQLLPKKLTGKQWDEIVRAMLAIATSI